MTVNKTGWSGGRVFKSAVNRLPLGVVTTIFLLVFFIAALVVLYVLGNHELFGMRHLNAEYISWKDRLLVAGAVVTLSGAVVALVVNYRKQNDVETNRFSTTFADAAGQLGDPSPAVRIAGVYAIAALADEYRDRRQQCIDVLCGYMRLPYNPEAGAGHLTETSVETTHSEKTKTVKREAYRTDDREVRRTIIRTIRDHLRPQAEAGWHKYDFDFTGAVFDGGDFSGAVFTTGTVDFRHAKFSRGTLGFGFAEFSGGTVDFSHADFSGVTVDFNDAKFTGGIVDFTKARFSGRGTVEFQGAMFSGGMVDFTEAWFGSVRVDFERAEFAGGMVRFSHVQLSRGQVSFSFARFSGGTLNFNYVDFSKGMVSFSHAELSGGWVHLHFANFSGGAIDFSSAVFAGGTLDLMGVQSFTSGSGVKG